MRRAKPALGTLVEVGVSPAFASVHPERSRRAISCAFNRVFLLQQLLSFHAQDSDLTRLNRHPGQWLALHRLSLRVLRLARAVGRLSERRFNPTCGGELVRLGALPAPSREDVLPLGMPEDIECRAGRVRLARPVWITLDGIAKGFAVDEAVAQLKRAGVSGGWVNAGGDLRVFGDASLAVTIRHSDGYSRAITLRDTALASSRSRADYDPRFPACIIGTKVCQSDQIITVRADSAWRADALTKVAAASDPGRISPIFQRLSAILGANEPIHSQ